MDVRFDETLDGHNWACWRDSLGDRAALAVRPDCDATGHGRRLSRCYLSARGRRRPSHRALAGGRPVLADLLRGGAPPPRPRPPDRRRHRALRAERVTIEPFDLRQPSSYDLVVDRLTHWYTTSREWIKKAVLMDGLYVFNNPWAIQSMEKHTSYCAMMRLGMPIPDDVDGAAEGLRAEARPGGHAAALRQAVRPRRGRPRRSATRCSPSRTTAADGPASAGSTTRRRCTAPTTRAAPTCCTCNEPSSRTTCSCAASASGRRPGSCATTRRAPLHDRYTMDDGGVPDDQRQTLIDTTLTINSFFGWEFNSCEALRQDGEWHPIDFANACPDSQVTSLHYHFPWLVAANLRWSIFCAATKRPMPRQPRLGAVLRDRRHRRRRTPRSWPPTRRSPDERFQTDEFESFCATHLAHLDEVVWDFFGDRDRPRRRAPEGCRAVPGARGRRSSPTLFWDRIQRWRARRAAPRS